MDATQSCAKAGLRMGRIRRISKILRAIILAVLIVEAAGIMAEVIMLPVSIIHPLSSKSQTSANYGDWGWTINWDFKPNSPLNSQTAFESWKGFILLPVTFMVTLNFFLLFTRLKDGHLYEGQTIKYLEQAGKWWIALGIAEIIYQFLAAYIFPPHNMNVTGGGSGIFSGLIVFFIAWVLREGQKLKEEQELTV